MVGLGLRVRHHSVGGLCQTRERNRGCRIRPYLIGRGVTITMSQKPVRFTVTLAVAFALLVTGALARRYRAAPRLVVAE